MAVDTAGAVKQAMGEVDMVLVAAVEAVVTVEADRTLEAVGGGNW